MRKVGENGRIRLYVTHNMNDDDFIRSVVDVLGSSELFEIFLSPSTEEGVVPVLDSARTDKIMQADILIVVFSASGLRSGLVEEEVEVAGKKNLIIIPVIDSRVRRHHFGVGMRELLGDWQKIDCCENDPCKLAIQILQKIRLFQYRFRENASDEKITRIIDNVEQMLDPKSLLRIRKRIRTISRIVILRKIVAESLEKLGYSVTQKKQLPQAIRYIDLLATRRGIKIGVKCCSSVRKRLIVDFIRCCRAASTLHGKLLDEGWLVTMTKEGQKRTLQLAKRNNVKVVQAHELVREISSNDRKALMMRLESVQSGLIFSTFEKAVEDPLELLKRPEGQCLEFKSSLRYDNKLKSINPYLEKSNLKTVCAFLNSEGGTLVIGVSDKRVPIGLSNDYKTLQKQDSDGFENHLTNLISQRIGKEILSLIDVSFFRSGIKEMCKLRIKKSKVPVFLRDGSKEEFYVRTGNNSRPFSMSEMSNYMRDHWS